MTIYATPFRGGTKETTGPSTDSGFKTLDQVRAAMPERPRFRSDRMVVYSYGEDRVVYSDFIFRIDGESINP